MRERKGPPIDRSGRRDVKVVRRKRFERPGASSSDARQRADELTKAGMPYQMAMAVVQGRMALNDAVERLAKRAEVERLMKDHDLSRALATQVVLGHADLESFLGKRRFEQHRDAHLQRSVLDEALAHGKPMVFGLFGQRRIEARVVAVTTYQATLQEEGKDPEEVHKLAFKYAYGPDDWKRVKKVSRKDKELTEAPQRPAERPQDRYTCSDRRLFRYVDEGATVDVTLLEGEIFRGEVGWFGRFEFGLALKDAQMWIFRHALHRIADAK